MPMIKRSGSIKKTKKEKIIPSTSGVTSTSTTSKTTKDILSSTRLKNETFDSFQQVNWSAIPSVSSSSISSNTLTSNISNLSLYNQEKIMTCEILKVLSGIESQYIHIKMNGYLSPLTIVINKQIDHNLRSTAKDILILASYANVLMEYLDNEMESKKYLKKSKIVSIYHQFIYALITIKKEWLLFLCNLESSIFSSSINPFDVKTSKYSQQKLVYRFNNLRELGTLCYDIKNQMNVLAQIITTVHKSSLMGVPLLSLLQELTLRNTGNQSRYQLCCYVFLLSSEGYMGHLSNWIYEGELISMNFEKDGEIDDIGNEQKFMIKQINDEHYELSDVKENIPQFLHSIRIPIYQAGVCTVAMKRLKEREKFELEENKKPLHVMKRIKVMNDSNYLIGNNMKFEWNYDELNNIIKSRYTAISQELLQSLTKRHSIDSIFRIFKNIFFVSNNDWLVAFVDRIQSTLHSPAIKVNCDILTERLYHCISQELDDGAYESMNDNYFSKAFYSNENTFQSHTFLMDETPTIDTNWSLRNLLKSFFIQTSSIDCIDHLKLLLIKNRLNNQQQQQITNEKMNNELMEEKKKFNELIKKIEEKKSKENRLTLLESIQLSINLNWPLTLVFNDKSLSHYQLLFQHIFYVKQVERSLNNLWLMQMNYGKLFSSGKLKKRRQSTRPPTPSTNFKLDRSETKLVWRSFNSANALIRKMVSFIRSYILFLHYDTTEPIWNEFFEKFKCIKTLDELDYLHLSTLDLIITKIFMKCLSIQRRLFKLFATIISFCNYMKRIYKSVNVNNRKIGISIAIASETIHRLLLQFTTSENFIRTINEHESNFTNDIIGLLADVNLYEMEQPVITIPKHMKNVNIILRRSHLINIKSLSYRIDFNSYYQNHQNDNLFSGLTNKTPQRSADDEMNSSTTSSSLLSHHNTNTSTPRNETDKVHNDKEISKKENNLKTSQSHEINQRQRQQQQNELKSKQQQQNEYRSKLQQQQQHQNEFSLKSQQQQQQQLPPKSKLMDNKTVLTDHDESEMRQPSSKPFKSSEEINNLLQNFQGNANISKLNPSDMKNLNKLLDGIHFPN
ncbi:hypothetical protein SNEBB_001439 [Seison nebaliae]|nr:hypothetical protein SNEBB_001439 [Seison nebaliae]